jgi:outer membrane protein assembly factor BamD
MSHYNCVVDTRLDQSNTMDALTEFSNFLEYYPDTKLRPQTQDMIFNLQDKLVEKEYMSAKLYFDLGTYRGNCMSYDDNNFVACIVTAQNALKDYPYASPERKEELSIMILRSKYYLARHSIVEKRVERFRDVVDEYYAFLNEFPESQYLKEAKNILSYSERVIARKGNLQDEDDLKELKKIKKEKETLLSDGKEIMSKKKRKSSKAD